MILGSASTRDWSSLAIRGTLLERISVYKLLGVFISADLRWETHIEYIVFKAVCYGYIFKTVEKSQFILTTLNALFIPQ